MMEDTVIIMGSYPNPNNTADYRTQPGTVYGTWLNVMGEISLRAGVDTYAEEHLTTRQRDRLEKVYRDMINEAFEGTGIVLAGDEFIGPADKTWDGVCHAVLAELIKTVDFAEALERALEDTACEGHETVYGAIGTTAYCDGTCRTEIGLDFKAVASMPANQPGWEI